ncbi:hypothetical protein [Paraburkholderia sp.]|uniref:hypothetical protein n=1 Tax=Paraburkholderia sp. TaxID=1926495 RepID=UPI00286FAD64|nr:hypothetical protein [Paraburkholderia sp.]
MADKVTPIFTSACAAPAVAASIPVATHAAFIQRQTDCISTPSIIVFFIAPDFQAISGFESGSAAARTSMAGLIDAVPRRPLRRLMLTAWSANGECNGVPFGAASAFHRLTTPTQHT